jgi:hypothetical protein
MIPLSCADLLCCPSVRKIYTKNIGVSVTVAGTVGSVNISASDDVKVEGEEIKLN